MAVENLVRLRCKDYGFKCNFEVVGEDVMKIMYVFGNHTSLEHGIKYEKESLAQFIIGSVCSCPYCNSRFDSKEDLSKHIDRIHQGAGLLEGDMRQF